MDRSEEMREARRASLKMVVPDSWNRLTETIIGAAIEVHRALGPGLLEKVYEVALVHELELRGLGVQRQRSIRLRYKEMLLPEQKLDLFVNEMVVVELKSAEGVSDANLAQLTSYMRAADAPLGLLINFNHVRLIDGVYRRINPRAAAARALNHSVPSASL